MTHWRKQRREQSKNKEWNKWKSEEWTKRKSEGCNKARVKDETKKE
jgi:hypothetical protein